MVFNLKQEIVSYVTLTYKLASISEMPSQALKIAALGFVAGISRVWIEIAKSAKTAEDHEVILPEVAETMALAVRLSQIPHAEVAAFLTAEANN